MVPTNTCKICCTISNGYGNNIIKQITKHIASNFASKDNINNYNAEDEKDDKDHNDRKDTNGSKPDYKQLELMKNVKLLQMFDRGNERLIQFLMQHNIRSSLTNDIINMMLQYLTEKEKNLMEERCNYNYKYDCDYHEKSGYFCDVSFDTLLVISNYLSLSDTINLGCCNRSMYITTQNESFFKHRTKLDKLALNPITIVTMATQQHGADLFRFSQCKSLSIEFTKKEKCLSPDSCMLNLLIKQSKSSLYNTNWLEILVSNATTIIMTSDGNETNCFSCHYIQQFLESEQTT